MLIPIRFPDMAPSWPSILCCFTFSFAPSLMAFPKAFSSALSIPLLLVHLHNCSINCQIDVLSPGTSRGGFMEEARVSERGWILVGKMHTGERESQIKGTVLTKVQRERSPGCVRGTVLLIGNCLSHTGQIPIFLCWLFRQELISSPPCPLLAITIYSDAQCTERVAHITCFIYNMFFYSQFYKPEASNAPVMRHIWLDIILSLF